MYKFKDLSIIIILFLILTPVKVFPQEEKREVMNFSIEKTITTALSNSLELSGIEQDILASDARVSQAETGKYPSFSSKLYYSRIHNLPSFSFGDMAEVEIGEKDQAQLLFNFNYPLYDGNLTSSLTEQTTLLKESLKCDKETIKQDVIFRTIEADYTLLKAQAMFHVAEKTLETAQVQLKTANSFYKEGLVPMADVLNAKALVANSELDIIKTKSGIDQAKSIVKNVMYIPLNSNIEVITEIPSCEPLTVNQDYITRMAYENRSEIKKMEFLTLAAQSAIDVAKSGRKPVIYFNFDYIPCSSATFNPSNSLIATFGANIPIFDRGLTTYKIEEAEKNLKRSEIAVEQVKKEIALQVQQAYLDFLKAEEEVYKVEESLRAAEQNYKVSTLRYQEGVAPFLEVTDSRALLSRAETDRVHARYNYFIALARLIRTAGILPENGNLYNIKLSEN